MAFKKMKSGGLPHRPPAGSEHHGDHTTDGLSDLYNKGRLPIARAGHNASGHNVHGAPGGPPPGLKRNMRDPAVSSQRFPMGGSVGGSGGNAPSEPAEPHQPYGFDPHK
jgi:hypothetical protein